MKKNLGLILIGALMVTTSTTQASDRVSLDELLRLRDVVKGLKRLGSQDPENANRLSQAIKDPDFNKRKEQKQTQRRLCALVA